MSVTEEPPTLMMFRDVREDLADRPDLRVDQVHRHQVQPAGHEVRARAGDADGDRLLDAQPLELLADYGHGVPVVAPGHAMHHAALGVEHDGLDENAAHVKADSGNGCKAIRTLLLLSVTGLLRLKGIACLVEQRSNSPRRRSKAIISALRRQSIE